jgi:hypothetical protein
MNLTITLALLGASVALTVLFGWLGARPKVPGQPQLMPWQVFMMFTAAVSLMMLVHLLNLGGASTGANRPY